MEEKKFSAKKRYRLYNIMVWLGTILAVAGFFMESRYHALLTWVGFGIVVLSIVFRFTMVRCPHCGDYLAGDKSIPDKCPKCKGEIN